MRIIGRSCWRRSLSGRFGPARNSTINRAEPQHHRTGSQISGELLYNELDQTIVACKPTCRYDLGKKATMGGVLFRPGIAGVWCGTKWENWKSIFRNLRAKGKGLACMRVRGWRRLKLWWMNDKRSQFKIRWLNLDVSLLLVLPREEFVIAFFFIMSGRTRSVGGMHYFSYASMAQTQSLRKKRERAPKYLYLDSHWWFPLTSSFLFVSY